MKEKTKIEVLKIDDNKVYFNHEEIIVEKPYTIFVNEIETITLLCTPKSIKYLVVGYLFNEGFISLKTDINKININEKKGIIYIYLNKFNELSYKLCGKRTITSGCGKGTLFYNVVDSFKSKQIINKVTINKNHIIKTMKKFNDQSILFRETGGVHSCALCYKEHIIRTEEDIGRHNAFDKIVGWSILNESYLSNKYVLTSGRLSSEIVIKAAKNNIPAVISRSAPTTLAIDIAKKLNIMIIGFLRGKRMNIYTKDENFEDA